MQWSWPVSVNLHEATAFSRWQSEKTGRKLRLTTELEHHALRGDVKGDPVRDADQNQSLADDKGINAGLSYLSQSPVDTFPPNKLGFYG